MSHLNPSFEQGRTSYDRWPPTLFSHSSSRYTVASSRVRYQSIINPSYRWKIVTTVISWSISTVTSSTLTLASCSNLLRVEISDSNPTSNWVKKWSPLWEERWRHSHSNTLPPCVYKHISPWDHIIRYGRRGEGDGRWECSIAGDCLTRVIDARYESTMLQRKDNSAVETEVW